MTDEVSARYLVVRSSTRARPPVRNEVGPPTLLLFIIVAFFWKITLTSQFDFLENPDLANQVLPWQQVQAAAFHQGKFPAWDPYLWGGQSLIGQAQPGAAYPLNWILYSLPLQDGHIRKCFFNWYFALIHFLAALFCYWLCRDLERSRMASMIAGVAFGLSGVVGHTDWPQMLNGAIWAPLVLLFLLRAVRCHRPLFSAALSGFFLGVSWLSGHHQIPIFLSVAVGSVWVFFICSQRTIDSRLLGLAAVSALFVILTSALQVLPAYEYGHLALRWAGAPEPLKWQEVVPYTVHQEHDLGLHSLFGLIIPGVNKEISPYIGPVIFSLAGLGVALVWSDLRVRLLLVLSLAGLFLSLGHQNVFHGFLYVVLPLFEKARVPAMAVVIFNFGAAVLTAYGFDGLRSQRESVWLRRVALWLAWFGALLFVLILGVMMSKQLRFEHDDRIVLVAVLGLLLGALLLGYASQRVGSGALGVCCLLLLLLDLGNSTGFYYPHRLEKDRAIYLKKFSENQDIVRWIRLQPGPFRFQVDQQEIPFNFGDWYAMDVWGGYLASLTENIVRLGSDAERTRLLYGVRYWIGRKPRNPGQVEVYTAQSGLKIYEDPRAFPRVWIVHETVTLASASQIPRTFEDPGLDLRRAAFFVGQAPKPDTCGGEERAVLKRSDFDTVAIQVELQCRGLVMLSDNFYPGWTATVDGKPARIWDADAAIRAVEVGRGPHLIEMRYGPISVGVGAALMGLSLIGLAGLAWQERSVRTRSE